MAGKKMFRTEDFKTPEGMLSFAQTLFKARAASEGAKEKFGCTLIFDKKDIGPLEAKVRECIIGEWGEKGLERAKAGLIKSPFLAGDGKEARNKTTGELHPGMGADKVFIRTSAMYEPVVRWKSQHTPATEQEVYSGCRGFAVVNVFAWNNPQNGDGVSFGIQYFQKTADGEKIGGSGGVDAGKWFESVDTGGDAPTETKGGAGAGGLFG